MSWVGLRDTRGGVFSHMGLERSERGPFDLNGVLSQGTMMFEFASDPRIGAQTIVDYGSTYPWAAGLRVTLCPEGVLTLTHWQGDQKRKYELPTGLVSVSTSVTVTYTWDAPMRRGILAVECAERHLMTFTELSEPMPLSLRDGMRMMADTHHCRINPNAAFLALADEVMPIGALPTLGGDVMVKTPEGMRSVASLRAGQMVMTTTGEMAQVRWCGATKLPARGRFAPLTMRAPYHGLTQDITVAGDQRLRIRGPEVEYLFHLEEIRLNAGDLRDGIMVRPATSKLTYDYWQVVLDSAAPLSVAGLALEGLPLGAMKADPALKPHSVLANLPPELMPQRSVSAIPLLKSYEAHSLQKLRAA